MRISPGTWWGEIGATYVDNVPVNDKNAAVAPSYFLVDLRTGLEGLTLGTMVLSPWVALTNLLDENYIASVAVNAFGGRFFEPGPQMSLQVGFRASWGRR